MTIRAIASRPRWQSTTPVPRQALEPETLDVTVQVMPAALLGHEVVDHFNLSLSGLADAEHLRRKVVETGLLWTNGGGPGPGAEEARILFRGMPLQPGALRDQGISSGAKLRLLRPRVGTAQLRPLYGVENSAPRGLLMAAQAQFQPPPKIPLGLLDTSQAFRPVALAESPSVAEVPEDIMEVAAAKRALNLLLK